MLHACSVFCVLFHAKQRMAVLFFWRRWKVNCCLVVASERCFVVWGLSQEQQGLSHCRILQKRVLSDKKQSARKERRINIGKKTIQVSNFHNPAETNTDSKGRLLVFWRKTAYYLLKKILNRTKYGLIFQKSEPVVFSFGKDLERNKKYCRWRFWKRESI